MLVLSRHKNESIVIRVAGKIIRVMIVDIRGDKTRVGCEADKDVIIHREEVDNAIQRERAA